jgi:hypothetical protein
MPEMKGVLPGALGFAGALPNLQNAVLFNLHSYVKIASLASIAFPRDFARDSAHTPYER